MAESWQNPSSGEWPQGPVWVDVVEKGLVIFWAIRDSVCLRFSAAEVCHDGAANGRSEPTVLFVQSRKPHSGTTSAASDQSNCNTGACRSSPEAGTLLQRHRPSFDRP